MAMQSHTFFDISGTFVLDISNSASIIYIWYEDGLLRLSLANARSHRVSVPGGSHGDARERLRSNPNMKGGITNMAKKAKGGKKKAGKKR